MFCTLQRLAPVSLIYNQIHVKICKGKFTKKVLIYVVFLHKSGQIFLTYKMINHIFQNVSLLSDNHINQTICHANHNSCDIPSSHYAVISDCISRNHPLIIPYKSCPQPPYELFLKKYHFHKGTAYPKLI